MSLYKKPNSPYWQYDFRIDEQRYTGSTKQTKKSFAQIVESDAKKKVLTEGRDALLYRKVPILKEFAGDFLERVNASHSIKPQTKRYYRNGWRLLRETKLAGMRMDRITNLDCDTIDFPASNSTANTALRTLRRMFALAKELKLLRERPAIDLREEQARSVAMSQGQADAIAAKWKCGDSKDAFLIIRDTGVRPGECFSMRWEFVQWDDASYRNPNGKTKTARRAVPLTQTAFSVIKQRHLLQGSPVEGWVFPAKSACGHIITIAKAFNRARDAAGLPKAMVLYTARHGRMSDLAQVCTLKEVMLIGGHSDSKTALGYQHINAASLQAKLEDAKTNGRVM